MKRSFTVPEHLIDQAKAISGPRGLSAYMTRALETQLQIDRLTQYVEAVEAEQGPIPDEVTAQVYADIADADGQR